MNSRGQSETGKVLWELMALILVIIVVGTFLVLFLRFIFAGGDNERLATISGFQSLASVVSGVSNTNAPFSSNADSPLNLYIAEDYVIVGFSKGTSKPVDGCGATEEVARPPACGDSACLCVYPVDDLNNFALAGKDAAQPLACSTFGNVDLITSFWYHHGGDRAFDDAADVESSLPFYKNLAGQCDDTLPNAYYSYPPVFHFRYDCRTPDNKKLSGRSYASFLAYGKCDVLNAQTWGSRQIYVDRITVEGKKVVLISSMPGNGTIKERETLALKNSLLPLFDAAEKLFNEAKYTEAIAAYNKFIDAAKTELPAQVEKSRFKISESHYRNNAFKDAATTALSFMRTYGVRVYFLEAGLPSFTPLPLPLLTTNNAAPLSTLATDAEIALAKERFTKLQAAMPENAVLAYLLGHLERRSQNENRAIMLLEQAANTITPSDFVSPLVVVYDLGSAYVQKLQKSGFDKDIAQGLINADADIVGSYDDALQLLEIYNNANSRLAWNCHVWKNMFGTEKPCSDYQIALTNDDGWLATVTEGNTCTVPEGMSRCGDLNLQNIQDILGTGGSAIAVTRPLLHYTESYKCTNGKWTKFFTCQTGQYCQNIREFSDLSTQCFTPKIVETFEELP